MQDTITFTDIADILCDKLDSACEFCIYNSCNSCVHGVERELLDCKIGIEQWFRKEFQKIIGEDY